MQATGLELGQEASVTTTAPRAALTSSAPSRMRAEEVAVDHVARLLGQREDQHDDVGVRQQVRHLLGRRERRRARDARPASARRRRRADGARSAGRGRRRRSPAPACPEARRSCMVPLAAILVADEAGELPQAGEDRGQHPFGGCAAVDAAGVAAGSRRSGISADQLVDAGAERLDHAQPRHHRAPLQWARSRRREPRTRCARFLRAAPRIHPR